jgi:predicted anti-sigma-YlaC factor YlaD
MRFIYTCKQTHQILSEGLDRDLSLAERAHLKLHLSLCTSCTNFSKQMLTLRLAMRKMAKGENDVDIAQKTEDKS